MLSERTIARLQFVLGMLLAPVIGLLIGLPALLTIMAGVLVIQLTGGYEAWSRVSSLVWTVSIIGLLLTIAGVYKLLDRLNWLGWLR